jgi:ABC-type multidrug transport system ATPase subunit
MVIASHNLDELERLCDRVAILDKGKVQQVVTVRGVDGANTVSVRRWRIRVVSGAAVLAGLVPGAKLDGEFVECECDLPAMNRALASAIAGGALVGAVAPVESSLEEAFRVSVTR